MTADNRKRNGPLGALLF